MTEPTKEQAWKEEARKAYQDQQSQDNEGGCRESIGFVQGYLAAKKSDFKEIELLKWQKEEYKKAISEFIEAVKTLKEQLADEIKQREKAESVVKIYSEPESKEWISHTKELHETKVSVYKDVYSLSSYAKNYFSEKQKQDKENKESK